jgi:phosphoribosylamine--glycine ligase
MKILIVGHGGREHALLHTLHRNKPDAEFFITRGNAGTASLAQAIAIAPTDIASLAAWADGEAIDLTVVGPEAPLARGITDLFAQRRLPVFGPTRSAAAIEASKAKAKRIMRDAGVPTAAFSTFTSADEASDFIREHGAPIVVKASGLAAGKGAMVCDTVEAALDAATSMLADDAFGEAGREIVIEQYLEGEELSIFAITDGTNALLMLPAQDHKRIGEGDTGPNTGGMGAYAPVSIATDAVIEIARRRVFEPVLRAMRDDDRTFRGLLYAGLILTAEGPAVIEFNARFGDPETQALLPLLDSPLLDPLLEVARGGSLAGATLQWKPAVALTTVLASAGYPESSQRGVPIHVPENIEADGDVIVFHAGSRRDDSRMLTDGGRVLAVTAMAPTLRQAAERSRTAAAAIEFDGRQFRRDIGWRELARHAGTA